MIGTWHMAHGWRLFPLESGGFSTSRRSGERLDLIQCGGMRVAVCAEHNGVAYIKQGIKPPDNRCWGERGMMSIGLRLTVASF